MFLHTDSLDCDCELCIQDNYDGEKMTKHKIDPRPQEQIRSDVNERLWEIVGDTIPDSLLHAEWDPCDNWGQLGFIIDLVEEKTGRRLLIEGNQSPKHTYGEKLKDGVRAIGFYNIPEGQTMREGMWNIAWAAQILLDKSEEE